MWSQTLLGFGRHEASLANEGVGGEGLDNPSSNLDCVRDSFILT
jgi:hypothetical protein